MRRILFLTFLFASIGCSDDPRSDGGPPSDLVPSNSLIMVQIADPGELDGELDALGLPPTSSFFLLTGMDSPVGVDSGRPWYLVWAEDAESREDPLLLLPINDEDSFQEFIDNSPRGLSARVADGYALLWRGGQPELGHSDMNMDFIGDIDAHADIDALRTAYADEIQLARDSLQENMEADLQETVQATPESGLNPVALGQMVEAQYDLMFDILEQSDEVGLSLDLDEGDLNWSVAWALDPGSPWGDLVANQDPRAPSGLDRVDLDRPMVFWMNHDLSENQELLQPFFKAISGLMKGVDPEVLTQLAGQHMEGVMSMGWGEDGMAMEAVYSIPGQDMSEFRDLIREQIAETDFEGAPLTMEYRPNVGQIGDIEVDMLVQEILVPEDAPRPFPMQRTEVYYGWGREEMWMVMATGEGEETGLDRLRDLTSKRPGPIPDRMQQFLELCPEELLTFGWMDLGGLMEGISAMAPEAPSAFFPEGFPPLVFYGTAEGSQVVYGGSLDVKAIVDAATSALGGRGGRGPGPP